MVNKIVSDVKPKMSDIIDHLGERLKGVRTGGAQTGLVEDLKVDYYGSKQPLRSLASITTPEANLIVIQPFDANSIGDIRLAIISSDKGLNPSDDGRVIRISLPPLTEERRNELIKLVKTVGEESRIGLRQIRENGWKEIQDLHKNKAISDDDREWGRDQLNKIIDEFNEKVENIIRSKEENITKI